MISAGPRRYTRNLPIPADNPIVAVPMVTPFDEDDRVDLGAAERNIVRWLEKPATAFIVGTQGGEEFFLSFEEQLALARTVSQAVDDRRFVVGGIDCPSVTETLRRAEALAEVGVEVVRLRYPRDPGVIEAYFEQVLPRCPVPALLMHQPDPSIFGAAGKPCAEPETLGRVAQMDGVFGYVTAHDVRFEARVRRHVPADRRFWICNGSMILSGTVIGCNGTVTQFANIWPAALKKMLELGMAGRYEEAQSLQEHVRKIDEIMLPYKAAGIKGCMKLLGYEGMRPRKPTFPMPLDQVARVEQAMRDAGLLAS